MLKRVISIMLVMMLIMTGFVGCGNDDDTSTDDTKKEDVAEKDVKEEKEEKTEEKEEKKETEVSQVFTYNMGAEPETLDPGKATETVGINILNNTCEGLTRVEKDGTIGPGVAEKWDVNENGNEYTFYLRKNAKWSDGKPVTAKDFEYSMKRVLKPDTAADYAYFLYPIKNAEAANKGEIDLDEVGVKAIDDNTLKITLNEPVNYFLSLLTFVTTFPVREDVVSQDPEGWGICDDGMVGNGPFYVKQWKHNEKAILLKNPHYWDADNVKLEKFVGTFIDEESTALAGFEAGDLDGTDTVPVAEIPRLMSESDEFHILPGLGLYYYVFNNNVAPFDNETVRKALTIAIDREAIVNTVTMDGAIPASGLVPSGLNYGGEEFRKAGSDYDIKPKAQIEKAKKLLAEAGYPEGKDFPKITINYNNSERHKKIAEAIQEMWKKNLNIDVELANQEWKVHLATLEEGNYQVARIGWGADYVHPMTFFDMWCKGSGNNYSGYFNDDFDNLVKKAMVTLDEEKAAEILHEAEDMWMNRYTVCPIYYNTDPDLMKNYVKGWWKSPVEILYLRDIYIEK
ncbi:peptide ABC transporter substrate-binding protein [Dethiothermospora halolimnae]|uniref:peptide ABC transporter substrate-binding protein n=1 Tax=Dethiothermospora halolimnae TaxID=3114390 RepID=UPI003CCBB7FF